MPNWCYNNVEFHNDDVAEVAEILREREGHGRGVRKRAGVAGLDGPFGRRGRHARSGRGGGSQGGGREELPAIRHAVRLGVGGAGNLARGRDGRKCGATTATLSRCLRESGRPMAWRDARGAATTRFTSPTTTWNGAFRCGMIGASSKRSPSKASRADCHGSPSSASARTFAGRSLASIRPGSRASALVTSAGSSPMRGSSGTVARSRAPSTTHGGSPISSRSSGRCPHTSGDSLRAPVTGLGR